MYFKDPDSGITYVQIDTNIFARLSNTHTGRISILITEQENMTPIDSFSLSFEDKLKAMTILMEENVWQARREIKRIWPTVWKLYDDIDMEVCWIGA